MAATAPARTRVSFAERYCARHRLPLSRFEDVVLDRCLYPRARLLRGVLTFFRRDYFVPDLELVRGAGRLVRVDDFTSEAVVFWRHPANARWLRRYLRLRISTQCLLQLMETTGVRD
jgi:hypothetical protein